MNSYKNAILVGVYGQHKLKSQNNNSSLLFLSDSNGAGNQVVRYVRLGIGLPTMYTVYEVAECAWIYETGSCTYIVIHLYSVPLLVSRYMYTHVIHSYTRILVLL